MSGRSRTLGSVRSTAGLAEAVMVQSLRPKTTKLRPKAVEPGAVTAVLKVESFELLRRPSTNRKP